MFSHIAEMPGEVPYPNDILGLVEAILQTDERGRLVGSAPQFYLLRTRQSTILRFHCDLADDLVIRLEELCRLERGRPAEWQDEYGRYLNAVVAANMRISAMRAGPLYIVPDGLGRSGKFVAINESNSYLLRDGFE
jgi:hypothetical protein